MMDRRILLASAVLLGGCQPAQAATRAYQASDFTQLRVEGPFDVRVHTGVAPAARATGPQAAVDRVIVEQHGDVLVVRPLRSMGGVNWSWGQGERLVVDVFTHRIATMTLTGSGDVSIDRARGDALTLQLGGSGDIVANDVDVGHLGLSASGSGDLTARGRAREADALLVGSGDIHAGELVADAATVKLVGSGDVALGARRQVSVDLSGSGDVAIAGPAACTVRKTGSGDVRCARIGAGGDGD